jgi:hypothetical protein
MADGDAASLAGKSSCLDGEAPWPGQFEIDETME